MSRHCPLRTGTPLLQSGFGIVIPVNDNKSHSSLGNHKSQEFVGKNSLGARGGKNLSRINLQSCWSLLLTSDMAPSKWQKTRFYHNELLLESSCNGDDSPDLILLELCLANDVAATKMHQGSLGPAISILTDISQKLRRLSNSSQNNLQNQRRTFAEMKPAISKVPSFVEVPIMASETSHMFTNAIRLRHSDYLANFSTLAAVVYFNQGLARHIQAIQAYERCGSVASGILKVASSHYESSVSRLQHCPVIVQAAAFCNLSELCSDDSTAEEHFRDLYTDAFSRLDSTEEREIFLNNVSSVAVAA